MDPVTAMLARIETLKKLVGQGGGANPYADRKKNLLIYGLDEPTTGKETPSELRQTLKSLAVEMGYKDIDYDDAFRLGKASAKGPRHVLLKLLRTRDKYDTFNAKKKLYLDDAGKPDRSKKYAKIYINEDLAPEERKRDKALRDFLKEERKKDSSVKGTVRNGTLITWKGGIKAVQYSVTPDGSVTAGTSA
jgi:hypothetical protein